MKFLYKEITKYIQRKTKYIYSNLFLIFIHGYHDVDEVKSRLRKFFKAIFSCINNMFVNISNEFQDTSMHLRI